jgi:hypothetical protein
VFPEGKDPKGRPYDDLRWSRFKHFAAPEMYTVVGEHVFPFLRTLERGRQSSRQRHMAETSTLGGVTWPFQSDRADAELPVHLIDVGHSNATFSPHRNPRLHQTDRRILTARLTKALPYVTTF